MSFVLEFNIGQLQSCSDTVSAEMKVQMSTQTFPVPSTTGGVYDGGGLANAFPAVSWANPTVLTSPFEFGDIRIDGAPEAGALGSDEMSIEADNSVIGTVSGAKVRMYDLLMGQQTNLDWDPDYDVLHIRILHKKRGAANYTVRYWGILDMSSLEIVMGDVSDPDTYKIKVKAIDTLYILEKYNMITFVDESLPMAGAYTSTAKYMTFMGDLNYGGQALDEGRYVLYNLRWDDGSGNPKWLSQYQNPNVPDGNSATAPIRYFKVVDILTAAHSFLGLEGTVNNGAAWADLCKWKWLYNDAKYSTSPNLVPVGIDGLYVIAGVYVWDGTQNVYAHRGTFFDRDEAAPHSLMTKKNPLEMLKDMCISFGLKCRVAIDASGQRYLDIRAADLGGTEIAWDSDNYWYSDVRISPYARRINGIEIVSGESNIIRGISGNESVKIDCLVTCANHIRTDHDFRRSARDIGVGEVATVVGDAPAYSFWSCLWAMGGSPTGQNYPGAYTICTIVPGVTGAAAGEAYGGNYVYIGSSTEGGQEIAHGAIQTNYGYDFTESSTYSNVVVYPNPASPVNSWAEVPAMALSHYLYSPRAYEYDHNGLYRGKGQEMEITRAEIIGTSIPTPGTIVNVKINGTEKKWRIVGVTENLLENTTEFKLEYWL